MLQVARDRVRLQAEAAAEDLLHDLGGAAEGRLDAAEPPRLTIVAENSGPSAPVMAGSHLVSASRAFAWCDLGGDHAPWDRLAAWQLPGPQRDPDDHAEPAAADIPAVDTDVDSGELIAAQLPQVLLSYDVSHGSQVLSCSGEPPCGDQYLSRGEDAHHHSRATRGAR